MIDSVYENLNLKIWLDGKIMDYSSAKVPILTHSLQYGSGIFEGIRAYETSMGTEIFRLNEHIKRFFETAKIYNMDLHYSQDEIREAIIAVIRANKLNAAYIRPFAFYGSDAIGLNVTNKKVSVYIAAVPFGKYLSTGDHGVKCKVSSWRRINSDILPVQAKSSGNYINSIIASIEAKNAGFDEAVLLSDNGYVAEGPGENIFIVKNGSLLTPDINANILMGITRDTVMQLARSMNIPVTARNIHREELYTADEAFFSGTAAEITPIINVDNIKVGDGTVGVITKQIMDLYLDTVHGKIEKFKNWLTIV
ncbi:MAG: branched-chain amino acid transaminase [Thermoplasmata archaeon]